MAGMAANISAFNTVFSYDIWQDYVVKDRGTTYYVLVGRIATVAANGPCHLHGVDRGRLLQPDGLSQTLFGFFNAPLFATFILGMFWKRMTSTAAGRASSAVTFLRSLFSFCPGRCHQSSRPGRAVRRRIGGVRRRHHCQCRRSPWSTTPKPATELVGLVYRDTKEVFQDQKRGKAWYYRPVPLASVALALTIFLEHRLPTEMDSTESLEGTVMRHLFDIRNIIGWLLDLRCRADHCRLAPGLLGITAGASDNPVDLYIGTDARLVGGPRTDRRGRRVHRLGLTAPGEGPNNRADNGSEH